jgi:cytosine/uracil/thiamine/allantoin permease
MVYSSGLKLKFQVMKALNWIAWISAGIGVVFVILGLVQVVVGRLQPNTEIINFFHAANSFFLLTIALFVFLFRCQCKED